MLIRRTLKDAALIIFGFIIFLKTISERACLFVYLDSAPEKRMPESHIFHPQPYAKL